MQESGPQSVWETMTEPSAVAFLPAAMMVHAWRGFQARVISVMINIKNKTLFLIIHLVLLELSLSFYFF